MRCHQLKRGARWILAIGCMVAAPGVPLRAQGSLGDVGGRARELWLAHAVGSLVAGSDTVRLQLPGVAQSAGLSAGQAARLLGRYVASTREVAAEVRGVRLAGPDHGYVEVRRRYVVEGTSEEREETVFLGFRLSQGKWLLREVRIVP